jgi:hypothetical protein
MEINLYINKILEQFNLPINPDNLIIIYNNIYGIEYVIENIATELHADITWDNRLERQYGENHNDPFLLLKLVRAYIIDMKDIFNQYIAYTKQEKLINPFIGDEFKDILRQLKRKNFLAKSALVKYKNDIYYQNDIYEATVEHIN